MKIFAGNDLGKFISFWGCEIVHSVGSLRILMRHYLDNTFNFLDILPLTSSLDATMLGVNLKCSAPDDVPDPDLK